MKDLSREYQELLRENEALRHRVRELEQSDSGCIPETEDPGLPLQQLQLLIDSGPDFFFLKDLDLRYQLVNEANARFFDREKSYILGRTDMELMPAEAARACQASDRQAIREKRVVLTVEPVGDRFYETYKFPLITDGQTTGVGGIVRDITERKRAEESLREVESHYRMLFEHAPDGIVIIDSVSGRFVEFNEMAHRQLGYPREEFAGLNISDIEAVDNPEEILKRLKTILREGRDDFETVHRTRQGELRNIHVTAQVAEMSGQTVYYCVLHDITSQKRAEDALRTSEEKYRSIFEGATEGIYQTTPDGKCLSMNPAFARMFGYESPEQMIASVTDIGRQLNVNPIDREDMVRKLFEHGKVDGYEVEVQRRDGSRFWISIDIHVVRDDSGNAVHFEGTVTDITERKRTEEALKRSENRLSDIIEFLPDPTLVIDKERKVVAWNKAMEGMTGIRKEDMLGKGGYVYTVPFYGERRPMLIDLVFAKDKESLRRYDYIETQGDVLLAEVHAPFVYQGKGAYLSARASSLLDSEGNVVGAIESIRDITEQKRITEELQESEERYRTAIENSTDAVVMIKGEKRLYVNKKFLEMFGFESVDKALEHPVGSVTHPDEREKIIEMNRRRQRGEKVPERYELKGMKTNGDAVFVEVSATRTTYKGDPITLVYLRDVTARKHLEAQLLQSQKMEAIGTLAGGIAHDFNNILTAIIGYVSLLRMDMGNSPLRQYVDQILSSSQKAAALTRSLLAFGRKQMMELKPKEINGIVREAEKLLRRLLTEDIDFTVIRANPDVIVEADATQIDQVLINLAANARDAMPGGGKLTIETRQVRLDNPFVEAHGFGKPGDYALISVVDTGVGMDQETQEKIFEPFFTTKEVGKGTGLGLSIVYGVVKQHKGYITVSSEPNKGTRFDVYLPISKRPTEMKTQSFELAAGGKETILVAEDNNDVRRLAKTILAGKGYAVLEASDGIDAVRKFMEHKDKIDLLLFDVVMPGKNGKEAYEEIRALRPDIKVLFTSGYTGDVVLIKGISDEAINYISKPLTPFELLKKVREVLDK